MSDYTKDEALAFIETARVGLVGKVGFKWYVERLSQLAGYVEEIAAENESLNGYLDSAGVRDDYERYLQASDASVAKEGPGDDGEISGTFHR